MLWNLLWTHLPRRMIRGRSTDYACESLFCLKGSGLERCFIGLRSGGMGYLFRALGDFSELG